jgi:hypothetical protein
MKREEAFELAKQSGVKIRYNDWYYGYIHWCQTANCFYTDKGSVYSLQYALPPKDGWEVFEPLLSFHTIKTLQNLVRDLEEETKRLEASLFVKSYRDRIRENKKYIKHTLRFLEVLKYDIDEDELEEYLYPEKEDEDELS